VLSSPAVPELPEVETVRRSLEPHVVGRRVERVEARRIALRRGIDPRSWRARVVGATLERLDRRGKYLLLEFDRATAVIHLGMSGRLQLARSGREREPHTHLVLGFERGVELRFVDPRRFGAAFVVAPGRTEALPELAALGPDPVREDVAPTLRQAAARSRVAIRNLLLDQHVIAGLGNIYANEALARAGIHPLRRAESIAPRRIARLATEIHAVLEDALTAGGTTLADGGFADAEGASGTFAVQLSVYGREGEPCPRCGSTLRRLVAGNRSVFFCPRCQR
jgi:formamidopyrimidine-DNA glycosylase